ncbi:MAG: helix-turn-helix domain-containing protein [Chloroflexota bacterium]
MARRSYNQVCALAVALDLIGDRWTLMIIREMLFGARRYSDILRGTPGLGTNLLAKRLKELETAGLIQQRKLLPPASSTVYELTENGHKSLTPIIRTLTNMGVDYLQYPPAEGQFIPVSSTMGALAKFFQREHAASYRGSVQLHTDEDVFHCAIEAGKIVALGFGELETADLILHSTTNTYTGLIVGYLTVPNTFAAGDLQIKRGTTLQASTFFDQFAHTHDEATPIGKES